MSQLRRCSFGHDAARTQGLVGERADGLVAAISDAAEINSLVQSVNAARMANYRDTAAREGTRLDTVQAIAGQTLRGAADEVICAVTPESARAVGEWYDELEDITDGDVTDLLAKSKVAYRAPKGAAAPH